MENNKYRPRLVDTLLKQYIVTFGAICIEGPKWCGKTWTCEHFASSKFALGDPMGNFQNRTVAKIDLSIALGGEPPHLIDEWQEIPELWDAVRYEVDKQGSSGLFLLTGSSTPKHKGVLHSGAGRIARLRMRTMSLYEAGDSTGKISLMSIAKGNIPAQATGDVRLQDLAQFVIKGGWPSCYSLKNQGDARFFAKEYVKALLNEDMNRLEDKKRDSRKMKKLLQSLARNESTTASVSTLISDMREVNGKSLDDETISDYIGALSRMFVIDNQPPYSSNVRSSVRIKQAEKLHFTDPSIACALLDLNVEKLLNDLKTFGFMFEALCVHDLRIYAEAKGGMLYHYQDYKNREIDAVVEFEDGKWGAFEIKIGANQIDSAAESLLKIKKEFEADSKSNPPSFLCVICGMSSMAYTRSDGVMVVPITALRD